MRALVLLLIVAAMTRPAPARADDTKIYKSMSNSDMDQLAKVLRKHVAYLELETTPRPGPISTAPRTGYATPIGPDLLVTVAHIVEGTETIRVVGPKGHVAAKTILLDLERRVALLRTSKPVSTIGLVPVTTSPPAEREVAMEVFTLIAASDTSGVLHSIIVDLGDTPGYEGHPRIDIALTHGAPVFDRRARFIGYARTVAWDSDRFMLVPFEKITAARTSTGAAERAKTKAVKKPERPWWVR